MARENREFAIVPTGIAAGVGRSYRRWGSFQHAHGRSGSPAGGTNVIRLFAQPSAAPADHDLNPTEVRILSFLADGYSYQAVGDRLKRSINTVRNYIRSIYEKLQVHSKSEAVSKALRSGII